MDSETVATNSEGKPETSPLASESDYATKIDLFENVSNSTSGISTPDNLLTKPTFKNILQAKRRLQAFSLNKPQQTTSPPTTTTKKLRLDEEKSCDESTSKKKSKRSGRSYPDDKARAVIEEIEEIKRNEQRRVSSPSGSRSKERYFKKINKKFRNYRDPFYKRSSMTPEKQRKSHKRTPPIRTSHNNTPPPQQQATTTTTTNSISSSICIVNSTIEQQKVKKYPKNWLEFNELNYNFDLIRNLNLSGIIDNNYNDFRKQLLFNVPSLAINEFKMNCMSGIDVTVPFTYVRYTNTKPFIAYSVNHTAIKPYYLTRQELFNLIPSQVSYLIQQLYTSPGIVFEENSTISQRLWFPKDWKMLDSNQIDNKLLKSSVGLSFLQGYSDEDEEGEGKEGNEIKIDKENVKLIEKKILIDTNNQIKMNKSEKKRHRTSSISSNSNNKKKESKKKKKRSKKSSDDTDDDDSDSSDINAKKNKKKKKDRKRKKMKRLKEKLKKKKQRKSEKIKNKHKRKLESTNKINDNDNKEITIIKTEPKVINEILCNKTDENNKSELKLLNGIKLETNNQLIELNKSNDGISLVDINKEIIIDKDEINIKQQTPDTDDYHSHWESDDDLPSTTTTTYQLMKRPEKHTNRQWNESDEELFERPLNYKNDNSNLITTLTATTTQTTATTTKIEDLESLEIPLNITIFAKRPKWTEPEDDEIKEEEKTIKTNPIIKDNNQLIGQQTLIVNKIENEYEEFIKALNSDTKIPDESIIVDNNLKEFVSTTTDSSSDSSNSSLSSINNDNNNKNMKSIVVVETSEFDIVSLNDLNKDDMLLLTNDVPLPVPSPNKQLTTTSTTTNLLSNSLTTQTITNDNEQLLFDLNKKPFVFSSITLPNRKLTNTNLNLNDDSDSADFTEKFLNKKNESFDDEIVVGQVEDDKRLNVVNKLLVADVDDDNNKKVKDEQIKQHRKSKSNRDSSKSSMSRSKRDYSPRRNRYNMSPKRNRNSRSSNRSNRLSPSPHKRHHRDYLTRRIQRRNSLSPRNRKSLSRSLSPKIRFSSRNSSSKRGLSPGKLRNKSSPILTSDGIGGIKDKSSPINSPLDGFKRSVADSTISDDMLLQSTLITNTDDYSPINNNNLLNYNKLNDLSPKRISLDDRINQVLGIEKNDSLLYSTQQFNYNNYNYEYNNEQYQQHSIDNYQQYNLQKTNYNYPPPNILNKQQLTNKVVQVGNILQVVPTEEFPSNINNDLNSLNVNNNKPIESTQKIVQVGNMLQIVPATIINEQTIAPLAPSTAVAAAPPPPPPQTTIPYHQHYQTMQLPIQEKQLSAETLMKQKSAERKAEREKRRQEKEKRRKEKERKRKEKEKRRQLKLKLKTENMIKKALQIEMETNHLVANVEDDDDDNNENIDISSVIQWPPVPIIVSNTNLNIPNKGILIASGLSTSERKLIALNKNKSVQFADGIRPGEGTSPSGGEELSSPPPMKRKLPKEKRYKKTRIPKKSKKRKIKVKVIKKSNIINEFMESDNNNVNNNNEDVDDDNNDDGDEDDLPPPSPPPGSPPPHVFPSRIKTHTINNLHQSFIPQYHPANLPIMMSQSQQHHSHHIPSSSGGYHAVAGQLPLPPSSHGYGLASVPVHHSQGLHHPSLQQQSIVGLGHHPPPHHTVLHHGPPHGAFHGSPHNPHH